MIRSHDFTDSAALHHLTNGDTLCIVGGRTHTSAHVWIDRKPLCFDEDLARARIAHRLRLHGPVVRSRHGRWITCEEPSPIHEILHSSSSFLDPSERIARKQPPTCALLGPALISSNVDECPLARNHIHPSGMEVPGPMRRWTLNPWHPNRPFMSMVSVSYRRPAGDHADRMDQ